MVEHPAEYPWSSYQMNGQGIDNDLITPHDEYNNLGNTSTSRRKYYRGLFDVHLEPNLIDDIIASTNGNYVLGNDRFKEEIESVIKR